MEPFVKVSNYKNVNTSSVINLVTAFYKPKSGTQLNYISNSEKLNNELWMCKVPERNIEQFKEDTQFIWKII